MIKEEWKSQIDLKLTSNEVANVKVFFQLHFIQKETDLLLSKPLKTPAGNFYICVSPKIVKKPSVMSTLYEATISQRWQYINSDLTNGLSISVPGFLNYRYAKVW